MSTTRDFYLKQAEKDEHDAASATLDNVRERSLRSAQSWRMMAERLARAETLKDARDAEKASASGMRNDPIERVMPLDATVYDPI